MNPDDLRCAWLDQDGRRCTNRCVQLQAVHADPEVDRSWYVVPTCRRHEAIGGPWQPPGEGKAKRIARVRIPLEGATGIAIPVQKMVPRGVPEDAVLQEILFAEGIFWLTYEHPSFDLVPEGGYIPELDGPGS